MLLWVILAILTAVVLSFLLYPLVSNRGTDPAREAFNATVYRDQLEEIEADQARGLIGDAEAEAARLEVARRLLAADAGATGNENVGLRGTSVVAAFIIVALVLPPAAVGLYLAYGSPQLPDQPLAARLTDPALETNVAVLVARVEARLRAHPDEGEGWEAIAPVYMANGRYADGAEAYRQAIRLLGPTPQRLAGLGKALVLEQGGLVTEPARLVLQDALERDPTLAEPRVLLAVAKEQDGNYNAALEDWRKLLEGQGLDDRWRALVEKRIASAEAHVSGAPPLQDPETKTSPMPGPSAADVAAAQNMTADERQAMVEGMVNRLSARLDAQGDDLQGWLRLVRALAVLGRNDDAEAALTRAKSQFAGEAQALQQLDRLATELGLKS